MGIVHVLLCLFATFSQASAFIPDAIRHAVLILNVNDVTHETITKNGIKIALREYALEKNPGAQPSSGHSTLLNVLNLEDTLNDIFKILYGPACILNLLPYQLAVQEIALGNADTDTAADLKNRADYHFDAEKFSESNANVLNERGLAKAALNDNKLSDARKAFGHALHTLQDFYSHSNWVEMGNTGTNGGVGTDQGFGLPVASPDTPTCKPCPSALGDCKDNLLVSDQLTSGYYHGSLPGDPAETDAGGNEVPKPTQVAKCSHGGPLDQTSNQAPIGGINKDTSNPLASPHWNLHAKAGSIAERATADFVTAFRRDVGDALFDTFLALGQPQCQAAGRR